MISDIRTVEGYCHDYRSGWEHRVKTLEVSRDGCKIDCCGYDVLCYLGS